MSRKTQRYSKEFKAEAVRTVLENQLSISEGASRLSLPEGTLGQWVTAPEKGSVLLVPARWLNWNLKFCNCVRR
ncbi:transposase family protein [Shigella sonnei 53G]|nr:transposase family protein [Shigella sonnei 53G]